MKREQRLINMTMKDLGFDARANLFGKISGNYDKELFEREYDKIHSREVKNTEKRKLIVSIENVYVSRIMEEIGIKRKLARRSIPLMDDMGVRLTRADHRKIKRLSTELKDMIEKDEADDKTSMG